MKPLSAIALLLCVACHGQTQEFLGMPLPAPFANTAEINVTPAQRQQEIAHLHHRLSQRIGVPLAQQQLDHQIAMAEAEIEALDRHIAEYERISRPLHSNPFLVTLDAARLARLNAQLRLDHMQQQKLRSNENFHSLRRLRLLEMQPQ